MIHNCIRNNKDNNASTNGTTDRHRNGTKCHTGTDQILLTPRGKAAVSLALAYLFHNKTSTPKLYDITSEAVERKLDIRFTSDHFGYVTVKSVEDLKRQCSLLKAPNGHVIMVSFGSYASCLTLYYTEPGRTLTMKEQFRKDPDNAIKVYFTTHLKVCFELFICGNRLKSLKLPFSFHVEDKLPPKLNNGLYNCSGDYYRRFQHHVHCNTKKECEDGRDELEHCQLSSPQCQGLVAAYHKCYMMFVLEIEITGLKARDKCRALGYELASIKTDKEMDGVLTLFRRRGRWLIHGHSGWDMAIFGLKCDLRSTPFLYRKLLVWADKTVMYNARHIDFRYLPCIKDIYHVLYTEGKSAFEMQSFTTYSQFFCEKSVGLQGVHASQSVDFSLLPKAQFTFLQTRQHLVACPEGHVTHAFLSCDGKSRCGQSVCYFVDRERYITEVVSAAQHSLDTVIMYSCSGGDTEVSFSLLCDFRQDCVDNSDESFCHHPVCTEFACTNGQCVSMKTHCNHQIDCLDGSDENTCGLSPSGYANNKYEKHKNSFLINFDSRGNIQLEVLNLTELCPGTHYRCTKEWFYCLPIYTRCNGVFDCIFQEDERDCEGWTCPGLYRCRDSTVCVHADYMCDGWPQCPQRDDEWLCDMTCPANCRCQGHAFLCLRPFPAHLFPQLRYLDARSSGMTPFDLKNNTYIVRLSLDKCNISFLPDMKFPNLQFLDLSYNKITGLSLNSFIEMHNLQNFILKGNPLISITNEPSKLLKNLRKIDLSRTSLKVFGRKLLTYTPGIQYINISFSSLKFIDSQGFQMVPHLKELDVRGTALQSFPFNLFSGLTQIDQIYASSYRFCCKKILPDVLPEPKCMAPRHYLSSCGAMLRSGVYRLNFWFVAVLGSVGNVVCVICHCVTGLIPIPYGGPVVIFMVSLQCADFSMGIYTSVIAAAHETTSGQYVHFEENWRESMACKVASFLSLLSSEVSVLIIFLLTLDHLIVLCLPHNTHRFSKKSAAVACGVTWFVGISLAAIPLFAEVVRGEHYKQTAVCSLMLHDRSHSSRRFHYIHAVLYFNVCICLAVCVTLAIVIKATPYQPLLIEQNKNHAYGSVGLLMKIAATSIARWIAVNTANVLALAGVVGMETNVFMAVMMLPLSSAVNPPLCLWHAVTYMQRQKREERLVRVVKARKKCMSRSTTTPREEK